MLWAPSTIHGNHTTSRHNEYRPHTQHNHSTAQQDFAHNPRNYGMLETRNSN
jgi:hypothetical protein